MFPNGMTPPTPTLSWYDYGLRQFTNPAPLRTAIIQEIVPPYRVPFFNLLNCALDSELTIFSTDAPDGLSCQHRTLAVRRFGAVVAAKKDSLPMPGDFDLTVMIFDLRWLPVYSLLLRQPGATVLWGHGRGRHESVAGFKAALMKRSAGFIAYESDGVEYFSARGVPDNKLAYAGNTVYVADHALSPHPRTHFLYLGRLQERKGIEELARAYARLPASMRREKRLRIVGDGEMSPRIANLVEQLGISRDCDLFSGSYDPTVVRDHFQSAVAYVSPGHLGLGVLHAFAYGTPVISWRDQPHAPEVANLQHGVNGYLVEPSIEGLIQAMYSYCDRPELLTQHCNAAYRQYAEHRTMQRMVTRFAEALKRFAPGVGTG